jgi:hypothetical protein
MTLLFDMKNNLVLNHCSHGNTGCGAVAAIKPLALQFDIYEPFFDLFTQMMISFHFK